MQQGIDYDKKGGGWLVAGYIFALLGGLIGIIIGVIMMSSKVKLPDGTTVKKYDDSTRKQGTIILVIAIVAMIGWNVISNM